MAIKMDPEEMAVDPAAVDAQDMAVDSPAVDAAPEPSAEVAAVEEGGRPKRERKPVERIRCWPYQLPCTARGGEFARERQEQSYLCGDPRGSYGAGQVSCERRRPRRSGKCRRAGPRQRKPLPRKR